MNIHTRLVLFLSDPCYCTTHYKDTEYAGSLTPSRSSHSHTLFPSTQNMDYHYHIGSHQSTLHATTDYDRLSLFLKENSVQKDGRSDEQGLFVRRSLFGKGNGKGVGVRHQLDSHRFWFLQDFANMRRIAISVRLSRVEHPKWCFAAALTAARVALGAALHAHSSAARGRVNEIDFLTTRIENRKGRDAVVAVLLDCSECLSTRSDRDFLVAAALATSHTATGRAIDREELSVRTEFLHAHLERVNGRAAHATKAVSVFERLSHLGVTDKVLEFGFGFTTQALLNPAATGLADCDVS
jgi:hypothetical protein